MRVLEFGNNRAAGYCGRLFRLHGAEVVKLDLPGTTVTTDRELALDIYLHAGKQRQTLDYYADGGALPQAAADADIIVTDLTPAELDELGWNSLPGAHLVSISPFGLSGPYRDWQGFGAVTLAMGGYTYLMGDPGRAPLSLPNHYVEYQAAQFAFTASLASHTFETGCRHIEVSLLETVLSLSQFTTVMWTCQHKIRSRHGNRFENVYPTSLYHCKDGFVYINVVPSFWPALVKMIGRDELLSDERFSSNTRRDQHQDELDEIISHCFAQYTMAECLELGQRKYRFPIGSAMTLPQILDSEHLAVRHYWQTIRVPGHGTVRAPGSAFRSAPPADQGTVQWQPAGKEDI